MPKPNGSDESDKGTQTIKVGEKEYSVADVENLLANVSTLNEKGESVQGIIDMCTRFEMDPGEFLDQSSGALTVISTLMKDGVIDEQGQIVKKVVDPAKKVEPKEDLNLDPDPKKKGGDKTEAIVAKALEGVTPVIKDLGEKLTRMENIQTSMLHADYQKQIIEKHPDLSLKDADHVLSLATSDTKKTLWEHAEDTSKAKAADRVLSNKAYCEEHGLDYEKLETQKTDVNKLKEQKPDGGQAPVLKGKKIKLFRATGENEVTAAEASSDFLEKQFEET